MKNRISLRHLLAGSLLLGLGACTSRAVILVHPRSGATAECSSSGWGLGTGWAQSYVDDCTRRYEHQGYVTPDKLSPEQRRDLEQRGLMPKT